LGVYAARILNGEAPGDLLIQVVIKFELVINLTVAKAIGLELPARSLRINHRSFWKSSAAVPGYGTQ
jgi:putative ABC transport system substrate-binding protein